MSTKTQRKPWPSTKYFQSNCETKSSKPTDAEKSTTTNMSSKRHPNILANKKNNNINHNTPSDSIAKLKQQNSLFCVKSWNVRLHYTEIPKSHTVSLKIQKRIHTHHQETDACVCAQYKDKKKKTIS